MNYLIGLVLGATIFVSGCATLRPPPTTLAANLPAVDPCTNLSDQSSLHEAIACARYMEARYARAGADVSDAKTTADISLITLAATVAGVELFNGGRRVSQGAGLLGAFVGGLDTYLAPGDVRKLYFQASRQMQCIADRGLFLDAAAQAHADTLSAFARTSIGGTNVAGFLNASRAGPRVAEVAQVQRISAVLSHTDAARVVHGADIVALRSESLRFQDLTALVIEAIHEADRSTVVSFYSSGKDVSAAQKKIDDFAKSLKQKKSQEADVNAAIADAKTDAAAAKAKSEALDDAAGQMRMPNLATLEKHTRAEAQTQRHYAETLALVLKAAQDAAATTATLDDRIIDLDSCLSTP